MKDYNSLNPLIKEYDLLRFLDMVDQYSNYPEEYFPETLTFALEQRLMEMRPGGLRLSAKGLALHITLCNKFPMYEEEGKISDWSGVVHELHKIYSEG